MGWRYLLASFRKVHNSKNALAAKIDLRRRVLEHVSPAHVLDVFCGQVGEMWQRAWFDAESYLGIDREWRIEDRRRRMVCDNRIALRALDLQAFNIFDLDAFGQPWEHAIILAARRRWAPGEIGAMVLTDGGKLYTQRSGASNVIRELLGDVGSTHGGLAGTFLSEGCEREILHRMSVDVTHRWKAVRKFMCYTAIVFRGKG